MIRFPSPRTPPRLVTLISIAAIGALTMNMFLPSLPTMSDDFGVSYSSIQLSVTLFLAFNAIMQLFLGPLSDRYGRRSVLLVALALFCLASFGTIIAPNFETFLFARIMQAAVVAGLVLSRAAIRDIYDTDKAASMIGYVTMCMAMVPMAAPTIGGWMASYLGWISNFWVMFVLGLGTFALALWDMGETHTHRSTSIMSQFRTYPELFGSPRFWAYCISAGSTVGAYFAYLGGAAFVGSHIFDLSLTVLGMYFGAPALGYAIGNGLSGLFSVRFGVNKMVLVGAGCSSIGMIIALGLMQMPNPIPLFFFGPVALVGLGSGMDLAQCHLWYDVRAPASGWIGLWYWWHDHDGRWGDLGRVDGDHPCARRGGRAFDPDHAGMFFAALRRHHLCDTARSADHQPRTCASR